MQKILITGGTGLIGQTLTRLLTSKGFHVTILTRSLKDVKPTEKVAYALWNVKNQTIDEQAVREADAIVHLAGAGVMDKSWTKAFKKEIIESRTRSAELLVNTLKKHPHKTRVFVSASGIGIYGADKVAGHYFTENDPVDPGFLGETCRLWEASVDAVAAAGVRVCKLRTGVVLSREGGALVEFLKPLHWGIAGILGNGKQLLSWIHIDDLCRAYLYAIENTAMHGSYNAVAPVPVNNKTLIIQLAEITRGRFYIPLHVPAFLIKLVLGARSLEVLKSSRVSSTRIREAGFTFLYPSLESALQQLFKKTNLKVSPQEPAPAK